jgi:hypothetical protein
VRQAVLLGAALALVWFASNVLGRDVAAAAWSPGANPDIGYWIAWDALALAAPLGAWLAPRPVVAVSALAPAAVWAWQYWGDWMVIEPAGWLILLAILVYGRERLPRSWLWLAGAISAANILDQLTIAPLYASHGPLHTPLAIALWIILGVVVFWAAVDARPALAMAIWLALYYLIPSLLGYIAHGVIGIAGPGPWQWPWQWYLLAAGSVVLSAAALWRLRHQAAL